MLFCLSKVFSTAVVHVSEEGKQVSEEVEKMVHTRQTLMAVNVVGN